MRTLNPDTAGIDISSREHYVAVPEGRSEKTVHRFDGFTSDLHRIAKFLKTCRVKSVVMESTGVYWFHLYTVLLDYGFEVLLVNARHVKNVPGKKSDVSDARWLQQLHSFGLLNGCFQPDNLTRELRTFVRQRKTITADMTTEVQRMQKALELMNIKLNNVIRDIQGKTGREIIQAILDGERNPRVLASHRDGRIKASRKVLIESLNGEWREDQLFNLKQAWDKHEFLKSQLEDCHARCERTMEKMSLDGPHPKKKKIKMRRGQKNTPNFNVAQMTYDILGVDPTTIYGISGTTALTILSETGPNLKEKFPSQKQFLSWLNLVPKNNITGGKVISSRVTPKKNRAGQAFRDAASGLWNAKNPLGDYLRRKKAKSGAAKAVVATARKIAVIYYKMVTDMVEFDPAHIENRSKLYLEHRAKNLQKALDRTKRLISDFQDFDRVVI